MILSRFNPSPICHCKHDFGFYRTVLRRLSTKFSKCRTFFTFFDFALDLPLDIRTSVCTCLRRSFVHIHTTLNGCTPSKDSSLKLFDSYEGSIIIQNELKCPSGSNEKVENACSDRLRKKKPRSHLILSDFTRKCVFGDNTK
jgi:hypothetical protein